MNNLAVNNAKNEKINRAAPRGRIQNRFWWILIATTILLCLADFFFDRHSGFKPVSLGESIEKISAFYSLFALLATAILFIASKILRRLVVRHGNYYGEDND